MLNKAIDGTDETTALAWKMVLDLAHCSINLRSTQRLSAVSETELTGSLGYSRGSCDLG